MKKKIAILTQPLGHNYGGILQNYALQQVIKKIGHNPVTINRLNNRKQSWFKTKLYYLKLQLFYFKANYKFISKHIQITEKIDSNTKFLNHFESNHYNGIIIGSDQTWRPKYSQNIDNYFLDFLLDKDSSAIKKITYASSFGTSEWEFTESQTAKASELVKQFDAVSVREDSGVELCRKHLSVHAELVLDPTMLLVADDYRKLYHEGRFPKKSGIFVYVLDQAVEKKRVIESIATKLGLDYFTNQPKPIIKGERQKITDRNYPPIETWIKGFDDADFIITDSFHGTVFSILYNKPFIAISNQKRGASRFKSLLSKLSLEHRLIEGINDISDEMINETIDYQKVNNKLTLLKEESLKFLKKNLS